MASDKTERLKVWIGLLIFVIGQAVSIGLAIQANKETKAQEAYKTLSDGLVRISEDNLKLHSDLANLRGYLAGLAQQKQTDQQNNSTSAPVVKSQPEKSKPKILVKLLPHLKLPEIHPAPKVYKPPQLGK